MCISVAPLKPFYLHSSAIAPSSEHDCQLEAVCIVRAEKYLTIFGLTYFGLLIGSVGKPYTEDNYGNCKELIGWYQVADNLNIRVTARSGFEPEPNLAW